MDRVTLRIPEQQIRQLEKLVERGEFPNRSEAIRACVRDDLRRRRERRSRQWAEEVPGDD